MLKDSPLNRHLIRLSILALTSIGPLSTIYILLSPIPIPHLRPTIPALFPLGFLLNLLSLLAFFECLFLLLIHLPRKHLFINRRPLPYQPLHTPEKRRAMLVRTWDATPEPRRYVEMYFYGVPLEALGRGDVRRWLVWRLWGVYAEKAGGGEGEGVVDEDEVQEYIKYCEGVLGVEFPEGDGGYGSLAVKFERVRMVRRPLVWYGIIAVVDAIAFVGMWWRGFSFRGRMGEVVRSFPFRPLAVFGRWSPTKAFGYWYREHTLEARAEGSLPVLFVHGIGVGLHFYLPFFSELTQHCTDTGVGFIALEVLAVCNRMTGSLPPPNEIAEAIERILDHHGWEKCVLVTHSYGSAFAAHMMKHPTAKNRIGPMVFVDPVAFSFHPPDVAWNFLRRQPVTASQCQLWYFASNDPDVARLLTRDFRWLESSLWREDLYEHINEPGRNDTRVTVMLSGADIITDVSTLGEYLTREPTDEKWYHQRKHQSPDYSWMDRKWTGKSSLEVLLVPGLNHSEIFEDKAARLALSNIVKQYTTPVPSQHIP